MLPARSASRFVQNLYRFHSTSTASSVSIDAKEVEKFGKMSAEWADPTGPFSALHSLNRVRVPWIVDNVGKGQGSGPARVVDVGSGGGLLSVPLARSGFDVTGIDATKEAVEAARLSLKVKALERAGIADRLRFEHTSVEAFCQKPENKAAFDGVIASEIVEHVADLPSFINSVGALARPGAPVFITTMNRTFLSKVAAIWLAEDILRIVPPGVHDWEKFITPAEMTSYLENAGCRVQSIQGLKFNPIVNKWSWMESTQVNYGILAVKK
ncbi:hypothetical protein GCK72_012871 [Caenorhabditis remanei]|nr:hypothetical protein GCK72_012871 [Caenorhabditis remanei]KAF1756418.1 hypothetical protein GCK72_012871 [Caenorhabditis remanei]